MTVRPAQSSEFARLQEMAHSLWPEDDSPYDFSKEHVFVWENESGTLSGFASVSVRPWVEGSTIEPCPHVEGWYVEPDIRNHGVGRALIEAIEAWCLQHGYAELTSDAELANEVGISAHKALGFEPTTQTQYFRKKLSGPHH